MLKFSSFSLSNFFQLDGISCSLSLLNKSKIATHIVILSGNSSYTHHTCDSLLDPVRIVQLVPEKRMFMLMKCQPNAEGPTVFYFSTANLPYLFCLEQD
jgi:hypothetical protein